MKPRSPRSIHFDGFHKYVASACLADKNVAGQPVFIQTMIQVDAKSEEAACLAAEKQAKEEFPNAIMLTCRAITIDGQVKTN